MPVALTILAEDDNLQKMRFNLVPKKYVVRSACYQHSCFDSSAFYVRINDSCILQTPAKLADIPPKKKVLKFFLCKVVNICFFLHLRRIVKHIEGLFNFENSLFEGAY